MATATETWTPPTDMKAEPTEAPIYVKAKVEWAALNKVNEMSGKFQVDLCGLSDSANERLSATGIKVKHKDDNPDKGFYITPTSQNPIRAYLEDGTQLPESVLLGNGTEVVAKIKPYAWGPGKFGSGVSPSLAKLTVTKLVEYVAEDEDDGPVEVL